MKSKIEKIHKSNNHSETPQIFSIFFTFLLNVRSIKYCLLSIKAMLLDFLRQILFLGKKTLITCQKTPQIKKKSHFTAGGQRTYYYFN